MSTSSLETRFDEPRTLSKPGPVEHFCPGFLNGLDAWEKRPST